MNRTAQVTEIAKCLDALPCVWECAATFERTIDGKKYLFHLFDQETSLELVAAFPLDIPDEDYAHYARMANDFTNRAEGARFYIRAGELRLSLNMLRRSEEDIISAEGIAYLLVQCESLIARFAPEAFEKSRREKRAKKSSPLALFDGMCRLIGLPVESSDDSDL